MVCEFSDNSKNRFCFVFNPFPLIFLKPCWPIYTFKISFFFCEHLFNLLLGYIVKHHILGANRGFHFPLWNLGFYSTQKKPFLFNLGSPNLIRFFTQNPGFWFLLYFIYNSLWYPLPSLWVLLILVKFSWSWILAILRSPFWLIAKENALCCFAEIWLEWGVRLISTPISLLSKLWLVHMWFWASMFLMLEGPSVEISTWVCFSWDLKHDRSVFNSFL